MHDYAPAVRERVLLVTALVLLVAGAIAAAVKPEPAVSPVACTRRVARSLHVEVIGTPTVERRSDGWRATASAAREVLRVESNRDRLTSVQLLIGPDADVLERPARLRALAVRC